MPPQYYCHMHTPITCDTHCLIQSQPHAWQMVSIKSVLALVSKKIEDLVREGSTDPNEVQRALREYVRNQSSTSKPSPTDRAYYPTTADICNHMCNAKVALRSQNIMIKKFSLENWGVEKVEFRWLPLFPTICQWNRLSWSQEWRDFLWG